MKINMWYKGQYTTRDIVVADCCFYPNEGVYRGNVYNSEGRIIGDYTSNDSVEIEKRFPGIFRE